MSKQREYTLLMFQEACSNEATFPTWFLVDHDLSQWDGKFIDRDEGMEGLIDILWDGDDYSGLPNRYIPLDFTRAMSILLSGEYALRLVQCGVVC